MRLSWVFLACALPAVAGADGADDRGGGNSPAVIGGADAEAGAWPDVAAVLYPTGSGDIQLCTGTLIAPTVVLTAAHCYDASDGLPDNVLIGTSSLARPADGETIAIARGHAYPDAERSVDLAVLVLARASTRAPRRIATGWARADIANGAAVQLVGYGAVDRDGAEYIDELQEARSTITDFDCSRSAGCNAGARPAGELGAGGMGIDTCPGDSGGPLYLLTRYGALLAGVTSRSYDNALYACSDGGIYERPDKVIDWIERMAGTAVARGPEPTAAPIVVARGDGGQTKIAVNDPRSFAHSFAIVAPPAHGTASVRGDGTVRVCADSDAPGDDALTVLITDDRHPDRALPVEVRVQIEDGAPAAACSADDFDGGGCCDGGRARGALPLAIVVLALLRRRRR